MNPAVSIIVPVYKVEPYLRQCLDSLRNQTLQELEIILVDDGSPDRCGEICDEYAREDSRFLVIHKENGGVGAARNTGLAAARGDFIGFVDSDDWIEPDMYEILYSNAVREGADIAICTHDNITEAVNVPPRQEDTCTACSGTEALRDALLPSVTDFYLWNKLVKRELVDGLAFPVGKIYEEQFVIVPAMYRAKKVLFFQSRLYHYRIRENSYTTSRSDPRFMDCVESYSFVYDFVASNCPVFLPQAKFRKLWAYFEAIERTFGATVPTNVQQQKQVIRYIRRNIVTILRCPWFTKMRKLGAIILCVNRKLYESLFTCLRRKK